MTEREKFESNELFYGNANLRRLGEAYECPETQSSWEQWQKDWQAARAESEREADGLEIVGYDIYHYVACGAPRETRHTVVWADHYRRTDGTLSSDLQSVVEFRMKDPATIAVRALYAEPKRRAELHMADQVLSDIYEELGVLPDNEAALREIYALRRKAAKLERVQNALSGLLAYAERNECQHDETYRGGVLWTICSGCGAKWADDEGGFQPYREPTAITQARAALSPVEQSEPAAPKPEDER